MNKIVGCRPDRKVYKGVLPIYMSVRNMPIRKQEFEQLAENAQTPAERKKRCDWAKVRTALAGDQAFNTDEVRAVTGKCTMDGKPMSRLRTRNWLLGLVKHGQAARKYVGNSHYYLIKAEKIAVKEGSK